MCLSLRSEARLSNQLGLSHKVNTLRFKMLCKITNVTLDRLITQNVKINCKVDYCIYQ